MEFKKKDLCVYWVHLKYAYKLLHVNSDYERVIIIIIRSSSSCSSSSSSSSSMNETSITTYTTKHNRFW